MENHELERWVYEILDRLEKRQPIEDSRVELKTLWPMEFEKAARQIAGHANSARGETILWIIGVDENSFKVKNAGKLELADWYPQVAKHFDERFAPKLVKNLIIPYEGETVIALLFETDRAPYVVVNPAFNSPNGGPVRLEVPWREHNSTRTATRADLIRILSPLERQPSLDVLAGDLNVIMGERRDYFFDIEIVCYIYPKSDVRLIIPYHLCEFYFEIPGYVEKTPVYPFELKPPTIAGARGKKIDSETISSAGRQMIVRGAGRFIITGREHITGLQPRDFAIFVRDSLNVNMNGSLKPVETETAIKFELTMVPAGGTAEYYAKWYYRSECR